MVRFMIKHKAYPKRLFMVGLMLLVFQSFEAQEYLVLKFLLAMKNKACEEELNSFLLPAYNLNAISKSWIKNYLVTEYKTASIDDSTVEAVISDIPGLWKKKLIFRTVSLNGKKYLRPVIGSYWDKPVIIPWISDTNLLKPEKTREIFVEYDRFPQWKETDCSLQDWINKKLKGADIFKDSVFRNEKRIYIGFEINICGKLRYIRLVIPKVENSEKCRQIVLELEKKFSQMPYWNPGIDFTDIVPQRRPYNYSLRILLENK